MLRGLRSASYSGQLRSTQRLAPWLLFLFHNIGPDKKRVVHKPCLTFPKPRRVEGHVFDPRIVQQRRKRLRGDASTHDLPGLEDYRNPFLESLQ